jgi:hypothetical protein
MAATRINSAVELILAATDSWQKWYFHLTDFQCVADLHRVPGPIESISESLAYVNQNAPLRGTAGLMCLPCPSLPGTACHGQAVHPLGNKCRLRWRGGDLKQTC